MEDNKYINDDMDIDFDDEDEIIESEVYSNTIDNQQFTNTENSIEENITQDIKKDKHLFVLTDRKVPNLLSYIRNHGVNVSSIFSNIKDARDHMIYQTESCRLVILETGLGKFTSINARKELVDTLGICDDDIEITVFYTDTAVKSEAIESLEVDYKRIMWIEYKSTADVVARLLKLNENYIPAMLYDNSENTEESLAYKGLQFSIKTSKHKIGFPAITVDQLNEGMSNPKYEIINNYDVTY